MVTISVVIPNYNGAELLKRNLSKVIKELERTDILFEIIVIDDGSTDTSVSDIKSQILNLKNKYEILNIIVLVNSNNLGFSSTVNKGVKEAKGEIIVLLNTDVYPKPKFLDSVLPLFTKDAMLFAVGFCDESIENGKIIKRGRGIGWWEKGFVRHIRGEVDMTDTFWVSGGSGAFRKSIWEKLGGLDELYNPFYWEDIDISYRAVKSGYHILFQPKAVVVHEHSRGAIKQQYSGKEINTIAFRNQLIFIWKNITDVKMLFSHGIGLIVLLVMQLTKGNTEYHKGFIFALRRFSDITKSRKKKLKHYKISDRELLMS